MDDINHYQRSVRENMKPHRVPMDSQDPRFQYYSDIFLDATGHFILPLSEAENRARRAFTRGIILGIVGTIPLALALGSLI